MKPTFFGILVLLAGPLLAKAQTAAQPALPTITLTVNGRSIRAEVADDPVERATGLMFREKLAPNSGMLFVMPSSSPVSFWMKNTLIPLSVAYVDEAGLILEIHDLKPHDETPVRSSFPRIAYALEMEQGWFSRNGVFAGDILRGLPPRTGR